MPANPPLSAPRQSFQKLPGRLPTLRLRLGQPVGSSLWLGGDCLLQTRQTAYRESYNRFDYKDIQALLLRPTARGDVYTMILFVFAGLFALGVWGFDELTDKVTFGVFAGIALALLIYNLARGKTCHCVLYTALGPKRLPTLNRLRPARRALRMIAERVEAVQGAVSPEAAAGRMDAFLEQQTRIPGQPQPPQPGDFAAAASGDNPGAGAARPAV